MDQIYRIDSVPIMKSLSIWVSVEELNQAIANFDFTVKWSYRRQGNVKVTVSTATYRSPILCQFKRATCSVLIRNGEFNAHKFLVEVPRMPFVEKTPDTTSNPLTQFINNLGASQGRNTINAEDCLAQASEVSGLYIHIPFCFHKCHYCDFYSIVGDENQQTKFVERLVSEFASCPLHNAAYRNNFYWWWHSNTHRAELALKDAWCNCDTFYVGTRLRVDN